MPAAIATRALPSGRRPALTPSAAAGERYRRQLELPGWGEEEQARLQSAGAMVVGAGALGSPVANHLAAAGVGRIGIVDSEPASLDALHRQSLQWTPDIGANRAESAAAKLALINPEAFVETYPVRLDETNAPAIVAGANVVADCSGSEETRAAVNQACCAECVPLVTAGMAGLAGWFLSIHPGRSACLECSRGQGEPSTDDEPGALGAAAGALGSLQALEVLKLLTGVGMSACDRVVQLDGRALGAREVPVHRHPDCPACGRREPQPQSG